MLHVGQNPTMKEVLQDLELVARFLGFHGGPIRLRSSAPEKCYAVNKGEEGGLRSRTL